MNLSHVEYYFADFLNALQKSEPIIQMYSKEIQKDCIEMQKKIIETTKDEVEIYEAGRLIYYYEQQYPASFKFPLNVRFIGTINKDETTKNLSPKVISRSFYIELNCNEGNKPQESKAIRFSLKPEQINVFLDLEDSEEADNIECVEIFKSINRSFDKCNLGVNFNYRMERYVKILFRALGNDERKLVEGILTGMVLPQINCALDEDVTWDEVENLVNYYCRDEVKRIWEEMCSFASKERFMTFWR